MEHIALEIEELEKLQVSKDQLKSHDHLNEEGGSLSKSHVTQPGRSLSLIDHQSPNSGLTVYESKPPWKSDPQQSLSMSLPEAALLAQKHMEQGASTTAMWEEDEKSKLLEDRRSSEPVAVKGNTGLTPSNSSMRSMPIDIQVQHTCGQLFCRELKQDFTTFVDNERKFARILGGWGELACHERALYL